MAPQYPLKNNMEIRNAMSARSFSLALSTAFSGEKEEEEKKKFD